jgi:hypothetical protein
MTTFFHNNIIKLYLYSGCCQNSLNTREHLFQLKYHTDIMLCSFPGTKSTNNLLCNCYCSDVRFHLSIFMQIGRYVVIQGIVTNCRSWLSRNAESKCVKLASVFSRTFLYAHTQQYLLPLINFTPNRNRPITVRTSTTRTSLHDWFVRRFVASQCRCDAVDRPGDHVH